MIGKIRGILESKKPNQVLVDVNGIGYEVFIPLSTFYKLPEVGSEVLLEVHTHIREDAFELFGFFTPQEKSLFKSLISVSKIGPKLAINIMSGAETEKIAEAIREGDIILLNSIPGVGKKTAERLIYELRDKISADICEGRKAEEGKGVLKSKLTDDVVSALINLGYSKSMAEKAVAKASKNGADGISVEELLKESLKYLVKHSE
ncbi:MAG: Holliday junction branch migration protein RuvA [Candidatus Schekmanbacteria bacterium]|nr:MAG: Holliday junction branch migration protein RuvA [Candidatus Schekmanbacteria bacterium]